MWPKDLHGGGQLLSSFEMSYIAHQPARSRASDHFPSGPGSQLVILAQHSPSTVLTTLLSLIPFTSPDTRH